jgi:radical SAM protein with 4Fe4S-binding SPASM domain
LAYLAESFAYLLDRGVGTIAVAPLVTHDPAWRPATLEQLVDQIAEIHRLSLERARDTGKVPFLPFKKSANGRWPELAPRAMCAAVAGEDIAVDVDGRVYGCVLFAESYQSFRPTMLRECRESMRIGDIRSRGFTKRLQEFSSTAAAQIFTNRESKYSSYRSCKGCRYREACSVCPASIAHIPDNTDPHRIPDLQCAFNLTVLTAREQFFREIETCATTT